MYRSSADYPRPLGVPLDQLQAALGATTLRCERLGSSLVVSHDHFCTTVEVVPHDGSESRTGPIQAVILLRTELPAEIDATFTHSELVNVANRSAAGGALTAFGTKMGVGSRLTIYEGEHENAEVWDLHSQLILIAICLGTDAVLGGLRVGLGEEDAKLSESLWTPRDFELVSARMSRLCVCLTEGTQLTAELGLLEGAVHSTLGHATALWQMEASQHPYAGGGLFCLLSMPHRIEDRSLLDRVIMDLNQMEMAPRDFPPHFGAWTLGRAGNNPAYCTFLPNTLHDTAGIAANMTVWAMARARWAHRVLTSGGISA